MDQYFSTLRIIRRVAKVISETLSEGCSVVAVVSAMKGVTNSLIRMSRVKNCFEEELKSLAEKHRSVLAGVAKSPYFDIGISRLLDKLSKTLWAIRVIGEVTVHLICSFIYQIMSFYICYRWVHHGSLSPTPRLRELWLPLAKRGSPDSPPHLDHRVHPYFKTLYYVKIYKFFRKMYCIGMSMPEEYVFHAKISRASHGLLCIYIPKGLGEKMKHLHRKEVIVRVTLPDK